MPDNAPIAERNSTFHLRRRTPCSFILVPSAREGRSIRCQGHLEADAATILASCPSVVRIREQPLAIWYVWNTKDGQPLRLLNEPPKKKSRKQGPHRTSYIVPDFLVATSNKRTHLIEVKASSKLESAVVQRKLRAARLYAEQNDWSFHLLTESELRGGPLLANLRIFRRYGRLKPNPTLVEEIANATPISGVPVQELVHRLGRRSDPILIRQHVFHMLATGRLTCDPCRSPIDFHTPVFPEGAILWDPFASVWAPSGSWKGGSTGLSASRPQTPSSQST